MSLAREFVDVIVVSDDGLKGDEEGDEETMMKGMIPFLLVVKKDAGSGLLRGNSVMFSRYGVLLVSKKSSPSIKCAWTVAFRGR